MEQHLIQSETGNESTVIEFTPQSVIEKFRDDLIEDIQDGEIFLREDLITLKDALTLIIQKIDQELAGE